MSGRLQTGLYSHSSAWHQTVTESQDDIFTADSIAVVNVI